MRIFRHVRRAASSLHVVDYVVIFLALIMIGVAIKVVLPLVDVVSSAPPTLTE